MSVQVQIQERPTVTMTGLPQELKDFAAGNGKELVLVHASSQNLSMNSMFGRHPLLYDELTPELQKIARRAFERPEKNDGELRRGDCVLVIQSIEERNAWRGDAEARLLEQESSGESGDAIEAINQEIVSRGGRPMIGQDISRLPAVRDHVIGGKPLADLVAQQAAEIETAKAGAGAKR